MKYSVIIPVYNSEKTIKRCIDSITLQNRSDVEIIDINEGSTDESESICKALQNEHENIIYIHQENGGVSSARNLGLSVATGEFVMFVDSDDYVDNQCFNIIDKHTESDADFYQFGFSIVANELVKETREFSECVVNTSSDRESFISESVVKRSINSPCAKIFKRKILTILYILIFCYQIILTTSFLHHIFHKALFSLRHVVSIHQCSCPDKAHL